MEVEIWKTFLLFQVFFCLELTFFRAMEPKGEETKTSPPPTEEVEKGSMDDLVKEESKKEGNSGKKDDQQDVVFIQDTGFTVKIVAPNLEPFDIQVSGC